MIGAEYAALDGIVKNSFLTTRLGRRAGLVAVCQRADQEAIFEVGRPIQAHAPVEIGSLTKGFTGILLAALVQSGRITMAARVDEVLFREQWAGGSITVEELVTHTSGLPRLSFPAWRGLFGDPYRSKDRKHVLQFLKRRMPAPHSNPVMKYSNLGFAVLGMMIEAACSTSYERLLQGLVLDPFGMGETSLQLAGGKRIVEDGISRRGWKAKRWQHDAYAPAGGLASTLSDLILASKAFCSASHPLRAAMDFAFTPSRDVLGGKVGLGWMTSQDQRFVWHNGATFGYSAFLGFDRASECRCVLVSNRYFGPDFSILGSALLRQILKGNA